MKQFAKIDQKPFAFWLAQQFLPVEENKEDNARSISNREFYSTMSMVFFSVCALSFIFHIIAS